MANIREVSFDEIALISGGNTNSNYQAAAVVLKGKIEVTTIEEEFQ